MLHFEELFGAIFNGTSLKASKINRTLKCFRLSVQTFPCGHFFLKYHTSSVCLIPFTVAPFVPLDEGEASGNLPLVLGVVWPKELQ